MERWLGWYRVGGLAAVLRRVPGHGAAGRPRRLTREQQAGLVAECAHGGFRTYDEARAWVAAEYGVAYRPAGLHGAGTGSGSIRRCRGRWPRRRTGGAGGVEAGGMTAALVGAGVTRDAGVLCADELRLGLRGQVRRVLAPRGVDVTQRLQLKYEWAYLLLAVDPRAGTLRWRWLERCRAAPIKEALAAWALDAVVWDGAGAHRAKLLADLPTARVRLPAYSPELNPAERVFEEIRRRTEGRVYDTVADKQAVAQAYLADLAADPDRVRRLCGWDWLTDALDALPDPSPPSLRRNGISTRPAPNQPTPLPLQPGRAVLSGGPHIGD